MDFRFSGAWQLVAIAAASAATSTLILRMLLATGWAWRLATDIPNARSLHTRPTPRVGGWGIVPVSVAAILLLAPQLWLIALAALGLAALSQVDDRRGLPARVRFAAHLMAVAILLVLYPAAAPIWLIPVGFLMVWLINLYNFMDGADGLAGGWRCSASAVMPWRRSASRLAASGWRRRRWRSPVPPSASCS